MQINGIFVLTSSFAPNSSFQYRTNMLFLIFLANQMVEVNFEVTIKLNIELSNESNYILNKCTELMSINQIILHIH
jgi:hypothetical protein